MGNKYYNDTEYYRRLKELISEKNLFTFSIEGRKVSEKEFYEHLEKIRKEKKTHADTI